MKSNMRPSYFFISKDWQEECWPLAR